MVHDNEPDHFELFGPASLRCEHHDCLLANQICSFGPAFLKNRLLGGRSGNPCRGVYTLGAPLYNVFPSVPLDLAVKSWLAILHSPSLSVSIRRLGHWRKDTVSEHAQNVLRLESLAKTILPHTLPVFEGDALCSFPRCYFLVSVALTIFE